MLSVIGGSSVGTLANFVPVRTTFAKNSWRSGYNAVIFAVPACIEYRVKRETINYAELLSVKHYFLLIAALICGVLWDFGLIYASQHLTQS